MKNVNQAYLKKRKTFPMNLFVEGIYKQAFGSLLFSIQGLTYHHNSLVGFKYHAAYYLKLRFYFIF